MLYYSPTGAFLVPTYGFGDVAAFAGAGAWFSARISSFVSISFVSLVVGDSACEEEARKSSSGEARCSRIVCCVLSLDLGDEEWAVGKCDYGPQQPENSSDPRSDKWSDNGSIQEADGDDRSWISVQEEGREVHSLLPMRPRPKSKVPVP